MKIVYLIPLLLLACGGSGTKGPGSPGNAALPPMPQGYSYERMQKISLENELEEVSGIFSLGSGQLLAHNDEEGKLYKLGAGFRVEEVLTFGGSGDYEEIEKAGDQLYILKSNGNILSMSYRGGKLSEPAEHDFPGKKAEFEAMYFDEKQQRLHLIVKNSKSDKENRASSIYAFDPAAMRFSEEPVARLSWDEVAALTGKELKGIHPSAAAVHPVTGELYLLAAIERLLLVLDPALRPLRAFKLPKKDFPQAEGISFDEDGTLYISNEAADTGQASLLIFPYEDMN